MRPYFLLCLTAAAALDESEPGVGLVTPVDGHVDPRVGLQVGEHEAVGVDQLAGLERGGDTPGEWGVY